MSSPSTAFLPELPAGARVLVVRLRSLGDALLLTPALRALKAWRPDLCLSALLYSRFAPILAGNPDLEEITELAPDGPGGPLRVVQAAAALRRRRFAACFNLHGGTLSALLAGLSGAPHRVGSSHFRYRFAYTLLADPRTVLGRAPLHAVKTLIAPFAAAGLPQGEIPPMQIFPQPAAREGVAQKLAARGVRPRGPRAPPPPHPHPSSQ